MSLPAPSELGLPFPAWRPGQEEATLLAQGLGEGEALFLDAPTGFGKSAVPAALAAMGWRVTTYVCTRDLQQQYADAFEQAKVLWGKEHYGCIHPDHPYAARFEHRWGSLPNVAECEGPACEDCPYQVALAEATWSRFRVLNYHVAFFGRYATSGKMPTDIFVLDEAHNVENVLRDLAKIEIQRPKELTLPQKTEEIPGFLHMVAQIRLKDAEKAGNPKEALALKQQAARLQMIAEEFQAQPTEFYVTINSQAGKVTIRPLDISRMFRRLVPPRGRAVLMSATLGAPAVLARTLGIRDYHVLQVPHPFDPSHRPVFFYPKAPALNHQSPPEAYLRQLEYISAIVEHHRGESGIVHTSSWNHAQTIASYLRLQGFLVYLPSRLDSRTHQVTKLLNAPRGTVAVSPSFWEGLDLRDDLCRFIIVAKVPFPDLADPVVRILLQRPGGRAWYDAQAALKVVQGLGRGVRHPDDYAVGYIVDANWKRVARYAPRWLAVSVVE